MNLEEIYEKREERKKYLEIIMWKKRDLEKYEKIKKEK